MSRQFQNKNKDLVNLQVVPAREVWIKNKQGQFIYRKDLDIFGKIDKGTSAFITNTNIKGNNPKYIEDTVNLPKKVKNDVVKHLFSSYRTVYLVKKK